MADILHDQIEVLKNAAEAAGSVVIDTVLQGPEGEGVLTAALNADEFVKVLAHCRPRIGPDHHNSALGTFSRK